jgi:hypothetical protein
MFANGRIWIAYLIVFASGACTLVIELIASLGILVVTDLVVVARLPLSLLPRIVFYTTAIFLLPSLVLGMVCASQTSRP